MFHVKDLISIILSYVLDDLFLCDNDEENEKIILSALKNIDLGPDGIESKFSPMMRDVRIYKDYRDKENFLESYLLQGSEYLLRKFMDKKICYKLFHHELCNNYMSEVFRDFNLYTPENLYKALSSCHDNYKKLFHNPTIKLFKNVNKNDINYFAVIFKFYNDKENYNKCLKIMDENNIKENLKAISYEGSILIR